MRGLYCSVVAMIAIVLADGLLAGPQSAVVGRQTVAASRSVVITVDDLPGPADASPMAIESQNDRMLAALAKHDVRSTAFVITGRTAALPGNRGIAILRRWLMAGHDLGNHTETHRSFNELTVDEFRDQVLRAEAMLRPLLPAPRMAPLYFRFPQNNTGDTLARRDEAAAFLKARGYEVAVCTIENADFLFARAYARAIAGHNDFEAARIRSAYLGHTAAIIDYFTGLHQQLFTRQTSHVMLLHVNELNADVLEPMLTLFEERGYRFVSLAEALADPAYRTPDGFVGKAGPMWAYRWARGLGVKLNGAIEPEPPAWISGPIDAGR